MHTCVARPALEDLIRDANILANLQKGVSLQTAKGSFFTFRGSFTLPTGVDKKTGC